MGDLGQERLSGNMPALGKHGGPAHICMHVLGTARTDARVMREAKALAQAGYRVSIVDVERDRSRPPREVVEGVEVRHLVLPYKFVRTRFKPWFLVKTARMTTRCALALLRVRADIYHAHDENALSAARFAARWHRKPLIFDAHELPLAGPNTTRWRRLHALATRVLRSQVSGCTAVITVSPPIGKELRRRYGGPEAVTVRNMPAYKPPVASNRLRRTLGLGPETRIALYQGYLLADRWLDGLIRSARYLGPHEVIVIMGEGVLRPRLEELIVDEGVGDRVKLVPAVPYADLLEWTASADLGLTVFAPDYSPSIYMCLPNKLFEYLMAGLPVLTSALPAVVEVVRTYDVGDVVDSLVPEQVGQAISTMLRHPDARERWRGNALAASKQELCWEREQHRLLELYERLLGPAVSGTAGTSVMAAPGSEAARGASL